MVRGERNSRCPICLFVRPDAARLTISNSWGVRRSRTGVIRSRLGQSVDGSKIGFFPLATRIENGEKHRLEAARAWPESFSKRAPSSAFARI